MIKRQYLVVITAGLFLLTALSIKADEKRDVLFQTSTIGALMAGDYDGVMSFGELGGHGDFGLGTFNELDGEMIALDGIFYQVKSDGKAEIVPDSAKTPFATVTYFERDRAATLNKQLGCKELENYLKTLFPTKNIFYAIKIDGSFGSVKTRSVPRQKKPYPSLTDVVKAESVFELKDVNGTLVGFWTPDYAEGISPAGFHFHFLTDSKEAGGHVLDCIVNKVEIELDEIRDLQLSLPDTSDFYNVDLNESGSSEVSEVEKDNKH
jgi:acetolactate decarboxylase